jgi:hypothetical protein
VAGHPPITPDELARATAVYLETGSYAEAGRAIGKSTNGVRDALRRNASDADRRTIYARTLDAALSEAIDAERAAVRLLRGDLKKPRGRNGVVSALGDATRTLITATTAHAKLVGSHAAEKIDLDVGADDDLARRLARLVATTGGDPGEPHGG